MGQLTENLEALCREEPGKSRDVVITLSEASLGLNAADLGIDDVEEIPGVPGILKGRLPSQKILELGEREEIEEISEDIEVGMHLR